MNPVLEAQLAAAALFVETWAGLFRDGTISMTCIEADTAADLLRAFGRDDVADAHSAGHAAADEPGDAHYASRS